MRYSVIEDKFSGSIYGICRSGWLSKIRNKHEGNQYDDTIEGDIPEEWYGKSGIIPYIAPTFSKSVKIEIDKNGNITII